MNLDDITDNLDSPRTLESLYRSNPDEFKNVLGKIEIGTDDSITLKIWRERLFFKTPGNIIEREEKKGFHYKPVLIVILLSLLSGTLMNLPNTTNYFDDNWYYQNFPAIIVILPLIAYYFLKPGISMLGKCVVAGLGLFGILFLILLPFMDAHTSKLSALHMPFIFLTLLGITFCGNDWKINSPRIEFLRFSGELIIYTTIITIGLMALTILTIALFNLIELNIRDWYIENIGTYGTVASPIVATFLIDKVIPRRFRIAPLLANIFTPLFLITVVGFLISMIVSQKSLYTDRDFLIAFNILLVLVLLLSIFSIIERQKQKEILISDYMSIGLVYATLIVDLAALSAIIYRLWSFGVSPNRIAVLGSNLVIFIHLAGIAIYYTKSIKEKHLHDNLQDIIGGYLPIYTLWCAIVAFIFPLIFWFK